MRPALLICEQTLLAHSETVPRVGDALVLSGRFYRVAGIRWDVASSRTDPSWLVPLIVMQATVFLKRET